MFLLAAKIEDERDVDATVKALINALPEGAKPVRLMRPPDDVKTRYEGCVRICIGWDPIESKQVMRADLGYNIEPQARS